MDLSAVERGIIVMLRSMPFGELRIHVVSATVIRVEKAESLKAADIAALVQKE